MLDGDESTSEVSQEGEVTEAKADLQFAVFASLFADSPAVYSADISLSDSQCPICLNDFQLKDEVIRLPCDHVLHFSCFGISIRYRQECPLDRRGIWPE